MNSGTCLCGDITWETDGALTMMTNCHCSICRKIHGSAYVTFVATDAANFRWTSGEDKIACYESSPGAKRPFCPRCGSSLAAIMGDMAFMPAGNLEGDIHKKPDSHIFVGSKAEWFEISDNIEQFAAYPPGYDVPTTERERPEPETDGAGSGSCECGKVRFEFDKPAMRMVTCHCSRCRRSRSAAFSVQAFVAIEKFRWLSGEDHVTRFKAPDSKYFVTTFCRDCASPVPGDFEDFGVYMLPAGSLDQDPQIRPIAHIYVGSKATWHDITDAIPQFDEMPADF